MSWIAKRFILNLETREIMNDHIHKCDKLFVSIVESSINKTQEKYGITNWYCSRPNRHVLRIYLNIDDHKLETVWEDIYKIIDKITNESGIEYNKEEEQAPMPEHEHNYELIQKACIIAINLIKKYPKPNRIENLQFRSDLRKEVDVIVDLMQVRIDWEILHYIENNLSIDDEFMRYLHKNGFKKEIQKLSINMKIEKDWEKLDNIAKKLGKNDSFIQLLASV